MSKEGFISMAGAKGGGAYPSGVLPNRTPSRECKTSPYAPCSLFEKRAQIDKQTAPFAVVAYGLCLKIVRLLQSFILSTLNNFYVITESILPFDCPPFELLTKDLLFVTEI